MGKRMDHVTNWKRLSRLVGAVLVGSLVAGCTLTPTTSPSPTAATAAKPAATTAAPAAASPAPKPPSGASPVASPAAAAKPAASPSAAMVGADYFAGKTVEVIVNFSPGGPTDTFARMLTQQLSKYIPGNPTVIVQNMAGAGGNIGTQHLYSAAKKDGLTMGVLTASGVDQLVAPDRIKFDITKFAWLGGVSETQVSYVRADVGITSPAQLPSASDKLVVGGLGRESNKDLGERLFLDMIGAKYQYVTGYPGNNDVRAALLRNEVNFFEESLTGWFTAIKPLVEDKTVVPMVQRGVYSGGALVRDARIPEIPTMEEIAIQLKGDSVKQSLDYRGLTTVIQASLLSRAIVYPPGTSPEVLATMRKAITDTFNDAEFKASASKQLSYEFEGLSGAAAEELSVGSMGRNLQDQEALEHIRKLAKEGA